MAADSGNRDGAQTATDYDLVIVGGGMVGASLAIALAGRGLRLAMIEAHPPGADSQPSYDDRGIALAYGTQRIFEALRLWPAIAAVAEPIAEIHVSDRGHFGVTRLRAVDEGVPALGQVVTPKWPRSETWISAIGSATAAIAGHSRSASKMRCVP